MSRCLLRPYKIQEILQKPEKRERCPEWVRVKAAGSVCLRAVGPHGRPGIPGRSGGLLEPNKHGCCPDHRHQASHNTHALIMRQKNAPIVPIVRRRVHAPTARIWQPYRTDPDRSAQASIPELVICWWGHPIFSCRKSNSLWSNLSMEMRKTSAVSIPAERVLRPHSPLFQARVYARPAKVYLQQKNKNQSHKTTLSRNRQTIT